MTTIIGIRHDGGVLMAADRQQTAWMEKTTLRQSKLFMTKGMLFGVSGTSRVIQLIQYHLNLRPMYENEEPMSYLTGAFADSLTELFEKHKIPEEDTYSGLLALKGELYTFGWHKVISQAVHGYEAEGSGSWIARGALAITNGVILDLDVRATRVLECAARHDLYTSAPFDIMYQEKPA